MTWKSYAAVSGAGLLATYLVSAPPTVAPGRTTTTRAATATGPARVADDIEQQAARLGSRVREDVEFHTPDRNPFRFGARNAPPSIPNRDSAAPRSSLTLPEGVEPLPVVPAPPPPIRVSGVLTNTVDGVRQRTAIFTTSDGVVTAREGEMAGAYRVIRVDEDAVEVAGPDGVSRRLAVRP
jgi:hypothetical protein